MRQKSHRSQLSLSSSSHQQRHWWIVQMSRCLGQRLNEQLVRRNLLKSRCLHYHHFEQIYQQIDWVKKIDKTFLALTRTNIDCDRLHGYWSNGWWKFLCFIEIEDDHSLPWTNFRQVVGHYSNFQRRGVENEWWRERETYIDRQRRVTRERERERKIMTNETRCLSCVLFPPSHRDERCWCFTMMDPWRENKLLSNGISELMHRESRLRQCIDIPSRRKVCSFIFSRCCLLLWSKTSLE